MSFAFELTVAHSAKSKISTGSPERICIHSIVDSVIPGNCSISLIIWSIMFWNESQFREPYIK